MSDFNNNELMAGMQQGPTKKVVPLFFMVDMSGSMNGNRIAEVNNAMNQLWPQLKEVQGKEQLLDIQVRVITFGKLGAQWKVGSPSAGVPADEFVWTDIPLNEPDGGTPTDLALELLLSCIGDDVYREYIGKRFSIPFMLLVSDGESNDASLYLQAIDKLNKTKIGQRAIMCSIGIDTNNNKIAADELKVFGRNGFRDCSDMDLGYLATLVSTATFRTINLSAEQGAGTPGSFKNDMDVFDDIDVFDIFDTQE